MQVLSFRKFWLGVLLLIGVLIGCRRSIKDDHLELPVEMTELQPRVRSDFPTLFQRLTPNESGIDFQIVWDKPAKFDRIFYSQNTGGGVCIGDVDGDGDAGYLFDEAQSREPPL